MATGHDPKTPTESSIDKFSVESDLSFEETPAKAAKQFKNWATQTLTALLTELELWHSPGGVPYATVQVATHEENWPLLSERFKSWLRYRAVERDQPLAGAADLEKIVGSLAAVALHRGECHRTWTRVGEHDGNVYVDLGDEDWRCVEIQPLDRAKDTHWQIIQKAPIKFVRRPSMRAMAEPMPGGSIDQFYRFANFETEADVQLTIGWIVASFRPRGPYPILIIGGTQGSGKSTLLRLLSRLVDPTHAPERNLPKDERDLYVSATNSHLQTFDNLSGINNSMSDALCRIATGGGFSTRTLHTDGEEFLMQARKPIIVNGISDLAHRGDLIDRSLQVRAARLSPEKRRTEEEFWNEFGMEEGMILGVLFNGVAWALGTYAETPVPPVRMSDAGRFMEASAELFGWAPGTFTKLLKDNRIQANQAVIESNSFAVALVALLEEQDGEWRGSATDLLYAVTNKAEQNAKRMKNWPASPSAASAGLDRIKDALEIRGYIFERGHEGPRRERRYIQFSRRIEDE
jgi:putative DNA primase/helicase